MTVSPARSRIMPNRFNSIQLRGIVLMCERVIACLKFLLLQFLIILMLAMLRFETGADFMFKETRCAVYIILLGMRLQISEG